MPEQLTPLSQRVFLFIKKYIQEEGYSPSQREIRDHLNHKTLSAVQKSLKRLERLHKIKQSRGKFRTIQIITKKG